jgi:hypothetical protein
MHFEMETAMHQALPMSVPTWYCVMFLPLWFLSTTLVLDWNKSQEVCKKTDPVAEESELCELISRE